MNSNRKLYIIRHAKAETIPGITDFDRALTSEGIEEIKKLALKLAQQISLDDNSVVISSAAKRTLQTTQIVLDALKEPSFAIQEEPSIYECTYKHLLSVINKVPDTVDKIILIGHNPTLSDLIEYLTRKPAYLRTAELAELELDNGFTFEMLTGNTASLIRTIR